MNALTQYLDKTFLIEHSGNLLRAALILLIGLLAATLIPRRLRSQRVPSQRLFLFQQAIRYGLIVVSVVWCLRELGFNLSVLLGAAGVLTVAVGFASQTSASNIISGLFLLGEQSFAIGDAIRVGDVVGEVLSIDLLSVKLRTFDNLMVRIPNETLLKANVANLTRFPIRRLDIAIPVSLQADLAHVRQVLQKVAEKNPLALDEPMPVLQIQGFNNGYVELKFCVWMRTENYLELRYSMHVEVKEALRAADIEVPMIWNGLPVASTPLTAPTAKNPSASR